jgi:hypothetical protein
MLHSEHYGNALCTAVRDVHMGIQNLISLPDPEYKDNIILWNAATSCPTTQHHNPADWNIFYTRFLLAENIKIPCFGMWRCAVWQACMSEGKESPPPAWPTLTTHHHTPADCTPHYSNRTTGTVHCLLYSYYGTFMSACEVVTLLRGFTCFWDTSIINTCPCIFSSPL